MKKIFIASILVLFTVAGGLSGAWAFERALGDLGRPDDYEETLRIFKQTMPSFDSVKANLPTAFDWRDEGVVTPAKDQGTCGSCWAFASVGALESKILMNGGPLYNISEQQLISCSSSSCGCCGGRSLALRFWYYNRPLLENCTGYLDGDTSCPPNTQCSCVELSDCEKLSYKTKGYYTVNTRDIDEIKTSLYSDGPAYFTFEVYADFYTFWEDGYKNQVYTQASGDDLGGHAILLIGWDDAKQAWLCKNSWGTSGPNGDGTFWIAYNDHMHDLEFSMANVSVEKTTEQPNWIQLLKWWLEHH